MCDFRIASTNARFADTHSRIGPVPGWGLSARLPQVVAQAWARQMIFTGDFIDADTALRARPAAVMANRAGVRV
jgi:enoyl-CoA hydratase